MPRLNRRLYEVVLNALACQIHRLTVENVDLRRRLREAEKASERKDR